MCLPGNVAMFVRTVNELKRRLMSQESGAQTPICSISHRGDISSHSVRQIPMSWHTHRPHRYRPKHSCMCLDTHIEPDLPVSDLNLHLQADTASGDICQETDCKTYAYWMAHQSDTEHARMQVHVWCGAKI